MAFVLFDKERSELLKRSGERGMPVSETDKTYKLARSGNAQAAYEISEIFMSLDMPRQALSWLTRSAEASYAPAEYKMGKYIYENGRIELESQGGYNLSYDDAGVWLARAADHESADAAYLLARICLESDPPDQSGAAKWYLRSYSLGGKCDYSFAASYCIESGERELALELCIKAAELGDTEATVTAGKLLAQGGEYADAERCFLRAAEISESVELCLLIGNCRENLSDMDGAFGYYERAEALLLSGVECDEKHRDVLFEKLGDAYYLGNGAPADVDKAVNYYSKVVRFGSEESRRRYAKCKFSGDGAERDVAGAAELGLPEAIYEQYKNSPTSTELLRKAASLGYLPAKYDLGKLYYEKGNYDQAILELLPVHSEYDDVSFLLGVCFTRTANYQKAKTYFELAAEKGNSEAEYLIGRFYAAGLGTPADNKRAVEWFKRSASHGDPTGAYELGLCCRTGRGTAKNPQRGMSLISAAADNGCAPAMFEMGNCIRLGAGVEQDKEKALDYYRKAADMGYEPAMYQLGFLYELGYVTGVRSPENALEWYRKCRPSFKDVAVRISACILEISHRK